MRKDMLEVGKPIPDDLREAIREETSFQDWVVICNNEGNKTSAYSIRDIVRGSNVGENSMSTLECVIRQSIAKLDSAITKKERCKSILKTYNRLNQITS